MYKKAIIYFLLLLCYAATAQNAAKEKASNAGWFSLGGRSTMSLFGHSGAGLGTGGQFRIQLSNSVNTDWFADYIVITEQERIRSIYYHIGWSVLYYPFQKLQYPKLLQPYIVAGHCFDYNRKTDLQNKEVSRDRWGSAVQAGIGTHFNLSPKFDVSLTCQYMIHLTKELEAQIINNKVVIDEHSHNALEGHLLTTVSLNYKLFRLWKK